ncbi:MAG: fluoride efflux transporter CrcB [Rickettsiales bacterium]|nr:fluoride efflux transporter CrcB [Rickettsiales bacterium]
MTDIILIAIGGAIGSSLRFAVNNFVANLGLLNKISTKPFLVIPYNTLFINVTGSFIAGFLYFFFANNFDNIINNKLKYFFIIGLLGGYTTFSSFSLDCLNLFIASNYLQALAYSLLSVICSLLAVFLGFYIANII